MGHLPDWYPLLRAAKYLGVAPWELLDQVPVWQHWALLAEKVEEEVQDELMKRAQERAG